ncbi:hypothetical protein F1609_18055 [Massilia sp. CCM 8693]|uniref:Uncharacterized protein n=2 Tax=Massilia aquatica TaxID=2609000 RepID=A0ABX0M4A9_9BURK|nr:hypothetical protein [Massilia aquatica]
MARHDYSDEDEFYEQNFEKKGVLSAWIGLTPQTEEDDDIDILQDLCGVGYYRLSDQESMSFDNEVVELSRLLAPLSYSTTYSDDVMAAAKKTGIEKARELVIQFDFAYDPAVVTRAIADDPVFIGVFAYSDE